MPQDTSFSKKNTLNLNGKLYTLDTPKVMGIINVTPDSFFSGSRKPFVKEVMQQAEKMVSEGVDIIDIGGYSSRPGAEDISPKEELDRVLPTIREIKKEFPDIPISLDTFRSEVAKAGVENGVSIINDISGGDLDDNMYATVASLKVPYILMHMRGTPQNMIELSNYKNVVVEVIAELQEKVLKLKQHGIADIIIDPGFGFAKNIRHNFDLLKNLLHFSSMELPLLVGISRKSMIYKSLNVSPEQALNGTTALHMLALQQQAQILRVHDVKEAKEAIKLYTLTYS